MGSESMYVKGRSKKERVKVYKDEDKWREKIKRRLLYWEL